MITIRSGLRALVDGVRAYFDANGVSSIVTAGFRPRYKQENQGAGRANRVVFIPGDMKSGAGGTIGQPREPGEREIVNPADPTKLAGSVRAIADWDRQLIVSVWSYDADNRTDDFEQLVACEDLIEWTKRAVDSVALANVTWGGVTWTVPGESAFGAEALLDLSFTHPLFDVPLERAFPETAVVAKDPES